MRFPGLETPRLRLRAMIPSDAPAVFAYMSDPHVTAFLPEGTLDEKASHAFVQQHSGEDAKDVAVVEKANGQMIGHMAFHPWFGLATYEIGWAFSRGAQGKGYATEAANALLTYSFETLKAHRVIATCQPENTASWRVAEKLGMRREAHFRSALYQPSGVWWDEYFYAVLAEEYEARRST